MLGLGGFFTGWRGVVGDGRFCFVLWEKGWVLLGQKGVRQVSILPCDFPFVFVIIFIVGGVIIGLGSAPIFWGRPAFVQCLSGFGGLLFCRSAVLGSRLESGLRPVLVCRTTLAEVRAADHSAFAAVAAAITWDLPGGRSHWHFTTICVDIGAASVGATDWIFAATLLLCRGTCFS